MKRYGESEQSCQMPLFVWKNVDQPLMCIDDREFEPKRTEPLG